MDPRAAEYLGTTLIHDPNDRTRRTAGRSAIPTVAVAPGRSAEPPREIPGPFRGRIEVGADRVVLVAGGLQVELCPLPASTGALSKPAPSTTTALWRPFHGQEVEIDGVQIGGTIYSALPPAPAALQPVTWASRMEAALEERFSAAARAAVTLGPGLKALGALSVRAGFRFVDGSLQREAAVVVLCPPDELDAIAAKAPHEIDGLPIEVAPAPPRLAGAESGGGNAPDRPALPGGPWDGPHGEASPEAGRRVQRQTYVPPTSQEAALDPIIAPMTITLHTSPDAGWPKLRAFFERVDRSLTVAMYDFTAPHVLKALASSMAHASGNLSLVLDPKLALTHGGGDENPKANDVKEDEVLQRLTATLGDRFVFEWAAVRATGKTTGSIFPSAYHMKVAVADSQRLWLSSGNWQSSNQPPFDPIADNVEPVEVLGLYNREWHVIAESPALARLLELYILHDLEQAKPFEVAPEAAAVPEWVEYPRGAFADAAEHARFFPPLRLRFTRDAPLKVQPALTPDNYAQVVLPLIAGARHEICFQNQYIKLATENRPEFLALVDALLEKQKDPSVSVRIILRDLPGAREVLEGLVAHGFDAESIRFQAGCHTKGILIDGEIAVVGSHNWSNDGTTLNRDASLIFHSPEVTRYFREIFEHDWEHLARRRLSSETRFGGHIGMPRRLPDESAAEAPRADFVRSTLADIDV